MTKNTDFKVPQDACKDNAMELKKAMLLNAMNADELGNALTMNEDKNELNSDAKSE